MMKKYFFLMLHLGLLYVNSFSQDFTRLYASVLPSVVTIFVSDYEVGRGEIRETGSLGAGVLIDTTGYIFTASHVVHTASSIVVKFSTGEEVAAQVVSSIPSADVALLKIATVPVNAKVATIGKSEDVKIGEQVFIIGSPLGLEYSLSIGHISGKQDESMLAHGRMVEFLQTDAAINPGNSGGPMFNDRGEVIGIVSYILTQSGGFEGIGFAVAATPAREMLFETYSLWTGFDGIFLDEGLAAILNVPQHSGLLVQHVTKNSMATKIGLSGGSLKFNYLGNEILLGGDIILNVQGTTCDTPHNFNNIKYQVENLQAGQPLMMQIWRHGEVIDILYTP
jgi:serine protease Do